MQGSFGVWLKKKVRLRRGGYKSPTSQSYGSVLPETCRTLHVAQPGRETLSWCLVEAREYEAFDEEQQANLE